MLVGKRDGHVDVKSFAVHVEHGDLSPAFDAVLEGRLDAAVQIIREYVVGRKDDDRRVAESVVAFMLEHPLGVSLYDGTRMCYDHHHAGLCYSWRT